MNDLGAARFQTVPKPYDDQHMKELDDLMTSLHSRLNGHKDEKINLQLAMIRSQDESEKDALRKRIDEETESIVTAMQLIKDVQETIDEGTAKRSQQFRESVPNGMTKSDGQAQPDGDSRSTASVSTRVLELALKKRTTELNRQHDEMAEDLQDKLTQLNREVEDGEDDPDELAKQIKRVTEDLASNSKKFGRLIKQAQAEFENEKAELELDEERKQEQRLDKSDLAAVANFDQQNPLGLNHQQHNVTHPPLIPPQPPLATTNHPTHGTGPSGTLSNPSFTVPNSSNWTGYAGNSMAQPTGPTHPVINPAPPMNPKPFDKDAMMFSVMQAHLNIIQQKDNKLPEFSGDPAHWSAFCNTFRRTCDVRNPGRDIRRLQAALKGHAKQAVEHLFANEMNVPKIISVLESRYGRPELILNHLVEKARQTKPLELEKPMAIVHFGTLVESLVCNIQAYGRMEYMFNPLLVNELVMKLPLLLRNNWFQYLLSGRQSTMTEFSSWLGHHVATAQLSLTPDDYINEEKKAGKAEKGKCSIQAAVEDDKRGDQAKRGCFLCGEHGHNSRNCEVFKKKSVDERWTVVRERKLCFLCFDPKHRTPDCEKKTCPKEGCERKHHQLLHSPLSKKQWDKPRNKGKKKEPDESDEDDEVRELTRKLKALRESRNSDGSKPPRKDSQESDGQQESIGVAVSSSSLLLINVDIHGPNGKKTVVAVLDSGATCSMLEEDVAEELGLSGPMKPFTFTVFGKERRSETNSRVVQFDVSGSFRNADRFEMEGVRTVRRIGIKGHPVNVEKLKEQHSHLHQLRMKSLSGESPKMVIGSPKFPLYRPRQALEVDGKPSAYRGLLVWYVILHQQQSDSCHTMVDNSDESLHRQFKEFFSVEGFGVKPLVNSTRSKEDVRAEKMMDDKTKLKNRKWETCLLWKDDDVKLPESKSMALRRLYSMEKKMDRNPEFAKFCMEKFDDYQQKQFLVKREVPLQVGAGHKLWYLPWFLAYHPSKKPRLVFDAAATSNGKCLNDFLMKGPDLIQSLAAVLTRFRLHQVALCGDIKEMFHQVRVSPEDRPAQTILYRGMERKQPPSEFEITVLFFGSASSPSSAIYTKNRNAMQFAEKFPRAVEATVYETYVDDLCSGGDNVEDAIQLFRDTRFIHDEGGFPLVKWISSSEEVTAAIPAELRAHGEVTFASKEDIPTEKTLGLLWNPATDEFGFKLSLAKVPPEIIDGRRHPTKRQVCSVVMSLFDPLGFVAPLKVKGMIILQNIWRSQLGWDDEVTSELNGEWVTWLVELKRVTEVRIPRSLSLKPLHGASSLELHTFCDASRDAFAAATYLRVKNSDDFQTQLVMGKVRVAPLRGLTIPRMELQAAVMGSRLQKTVLEAFRGKVKICKSLLWTDSKTVLYWIRNSEQRYNPFVGNRVGEILELTNVAEWRWVPTKENVADDATRLTSPFDPAESRWPTGSAFLGREEDEWPVENFKDGKEVNKDDLEANNTNAVLLVKIDKEETCFLPDIKKYSSWMRLIRATAMKYVAVRCFLRKLARNKDASVADLPSYLTANDLKRARAEWMQRSQQISFPAELDLLKKEKRIPSTSKLAPLTASMKEGLIVLGSRIENSELPDETKFPPILDPKEEYVKLLVQWYHSTSHHFGQERVLNELRKMVWIINGREAVRRCKFNCLICKKNAARPVPPLMGQLPTPRLEIGHRPFYKTGVDYFGPLTVSFGRKTRGKVGTAKRYGVLFTCMATRAVHLELAESLESDEMLKVLTRFINRRGEPVELWSDNGTNFIGAEREMKESLKAWIRDDIADTMLKRGIDWHFIGPASPHMGGSWESPTKNVKRVLYQLLKEQNPKEGDLVTFLTEVEAILNSRPLTRASPDPADLTCLTPNQLLNIPCVIGPTIPAADNGKDMRKSWKNVQKLSRDFWKRWSVEYLPWLAKRQKWTQKVKPLAVGDVVIVLEDNAPRNAWKMGILTEVIKARDGQVRSVVVKVPHTDPSDPKKEVKTSYLRRPAVKICPLNTENGEILTNLGGRMELSGP